MKYYTGIGTREITDKETTLILNLAKLMAKKDWVVYSGNADGSDITFQKGSDGKCVIMLPWKGFNIENYDYTFSRDHYILGNSIDGLKSIDKYHPSPLSLSNGGKALMARNYHQIVGYNKYPRVNIVICCAKPLKNGEVNGGTGQAVRIALRNNIPVINLRIKGWERELNKYLI